jgi:hypothetical protein
VSRPVCMEASTEDTPIKEVAFAGDSPSIFGCSYKYAGRVRLVRVNSCSRREAFSTRFPHASARFAIAELAPRRLGVPSPWATCFLLHCSKGCTFEHSYPPPIVLRDRELPGVSSSGR